MRLRGRDLPPHRRDPHRNSAYKPALGLKNGWMATQLVTKRCDFWSLGVPGPASTPLGPGPGSRLDPAWIQGACPHCFFSCFVFSKHFSACPCPHCFFFHDFFPQHFSATPQHCSAFFQAGSSLSSLDPGWPKQTISGAPAYASKTRC